MRILVVDDEAVVTETLGPALEQRMKAEVRSVSSGKAALEALEEEAFDVIIADYRMEDLDGLALLAEVRKRWPAMRRVMITAHADAEVRARAAQDQLAQAFLTKPYNFGWLQRTLEAVVAGEPPPNVPPRGRGRPPKPCK